MKNTDGRGSEEETPLRPGESKGGQEKIPRRWVGRLITKKELINPR